MVDVGIEKLRFFFPFCILYKHVFKLYMCVLIDFPNYSIQDLSKASEIPQIKNVLILMMILNKSAERIQSNKVLTMLECVSAEEADKQPSPRVVNCHYPPRYLPLEDMKAQQIKTVLCLRNPKDTAVSYYNHMKGIKMYEYEGKWENWISGFAEGKYEYGKYSQYLLEWQREVEKQEYPLHVMFYEDLKMKIVMAVKEQCRSSRQVGDWKNWFTVAQNEMFDDIWKKDTKDLTMFKFKYTNGSA
ncbi:sulfotransferase 1B1-like [Ruditapes philippinarum]|uniref:sulfotransferase 1B1-like n=1 Tax=Ruditapes philippinarum TaxID=129788 RepID=UPI00295B5BC9|nr:sulfotransferase 1B1-like [Ruditapes philippinarum]